MNNYVTTREDPFFNSLLFRMFDEEAPTVRGGALAMRTDIVSDKDNYYISIEIPGVKKENVTLSLKDHNLVVSVSNKEEKEEDKEFHCIRSERFYGTSSRSFHVGDATEEDINATYEDGVLTIKIAKTAIKKEEPVKKIAIN